MEPPLFSISHRTVVRTSLRYRQISLGLNHYQVQRFGDSANVLPRADKVIK